MPPPIKRRAMTTAMVTTGRSLRRTMSAATMPVETVSVVALRSIVAGCVREIHGAAIPGRGHMTALRRSIVYGTRLKRKRIAWRA